MNNKKQHIKPIYQNNPISKKIKNKKNKLQRRTRNNVSNLGTKPQLQIRDRGQKRGI